MWLARELAKLVVRIVVTTACALVLAILLAAVGAGAFLSDARVLALVFGAMLLAMGGIGRGSNVERSADVGATFKAWGTIPGYRALQPRSDDPRLAAGPAFFVSGLVLIALGVTVF